jgi:hypothetical protein
MFITVIIPYCRSAIESARTNGKLRSERASLGFELLRKDGKKDDYFVRSRDLMVGMMIRVSQCHTNGKYKSTALRCVFFSVYLPVCLLFL